MKKESRPMTAILAMTLDYITEMSLHRYYEAVKMTKLTT